MKKPLPPRVEYTVGPDLIDDITRRARQRGEKEPRDGETYSMAERRYIRGIVEDVVAGVAPMIVRLHLERMKSETIHETGGENALSLWLEREIEKLAR